MKVECVKQNIKDALLTAERFTGKNLSLPVLRYVLLIAGENGLKIRATNLDIGIEIEVPARIEKEGVIALPGDTLGNFLSNLPDEKNVTIEQIGNHLTISGNTHSTLIKGYGYEDFPTLPFITKGNPISLPVKEFISGIESTLYAVAQTDIKPEFASVYCYSDARSLIFVATDSSRLAEKKILVKDIPENVNILIPGKNAHEIMRALETMQGAITLYITKNQMTIAGQNIHITTRLIDGVFPDYKQIIPKQKSTEAIILRKDLIERLKLATVFTGKLDQIRLKIYPEDQLFEIESKNDDIGETTHHIDATLSGDSVEFLVNQRYINDVCSHMTADSITLTSNGSQKPIVITGVGDHSFLYLVMPMKG